MPPSAEIRARLAAAVAAHRAGDLDGAAAVYREVLTHEPTHPDALHLLGLIAHDRGDHAEARRLVEGARSRRPQNPDMAYNLGRIAMDQQDWPAAIAASRAALALAPDRSAAAVNLAIALAQNGEAAAAEEVARAALARRADAPLFNALGLALQHQGKTAAAAAAWTEAVARDPASADIQSNLCTARLTLGDLAGAWPLFGARARRDPKSFGISYQPDVRLWRGEPLPSGRLLVWGEQGLGDQLLFASLIPRVLPQVGHLVLAVAPRLVPLLARAFPAATVVASDQAASLQADAQIALGDLAPLLLPDRASIATPSAYLSAAPERVAAAAGRISGVRPRIGVSWSSQRATLGRFKSVPLELFASLFAAPATFVSLQYGEFAGITDALRRVSPAVIVDAGVDPTSDLDGLAALIASLDLVITVSNTTAHLAGALGIPVWTLVPRGAGALWYWFDPSPPWDVAPWYPAMRLYPQSAPGAWEPVIDRVAADLTAVCTAAART